MIFGGLGKIPSGDVPYPLFSLCALLPWQLFAYALTQASNSLVAEQNLITKVYFPRVIIPLSSVLSGRGGFRDRLRPADRHDGLVRRGCRAGGS